MTQTAFVRFKAGDTLRPEIFSVFDTGLVRATLPAEWNNKAAGEAALPVWEEPAALLPRYQSYDNALRDPDLDADD